MTTHVFLIRALTNLHVGSGDTNYGAVDKQVQRDPATNLPTIHSTSIKGALREHFEEVAGWGKDDPRILHIFGSAVANSQNAKQGAYHFFSADLLALAAPDDTDNQNIFFHRLTTEEVLSQFFKKAQLLKGIDQQSAIESALNNLDGKFKKSDKKILNKVAENLPVIARNQLENGISNNLWYEEIVPRETIFGWIIQSNGKHEQDFLKELGEDTIIQIGANATVGYGFCHFKKIK